MVGRLRLVLAVLGGGLSLGACLVDLGGLSGAVATSSTTTSGTGGSSTGGSGGTGSTGGADGGAPCGLLDCSCGAGPVTVASGPPLADAPSGIAVTADGVYWTDTSGSIAFAPASGGAPQAIVTANSPAALDASGDTLVWGATEGLFTCTASSCATSAQQLLNSAAMNTTGEVATDGQLVVWGDLGSGPNSGKVQSCSLSSCAPIVLQANMILPGGVRVAGPNVFWTEEGNGNFQGTVSTAPKGSTSLSQIASSLVLPTGLGADDTYVYWTESSASGQLLRCPIAGGSCNPPVDIAVLADPLQHPRDLRVAAGRIYWTTTDDGTIRSCPQPGCGSTAPQVHVTGRAGLRKIAVGASCIFWTEDTGNVMKAPR